MSVRRGRDEGVKLFLKLDMDLRIVKKIFAFSVRPIKIIRLTGQSREKQVDDSKATSRLATHRGRCSGFAR